MIQVDLKPTAARGNLQNAPGIGRNFAFGRLRQKNASAILHFEYCYVLLQGVGPRQIVVVFIPVPEDNAPRAHVARAGRFQPYADIPIAQTHRIQVANAGLPPSEPTGTRAST